MTVRVKICGITNVEDADVCADAGADAIGFVFYPKSRRVVTPQRAHEIIRKTSPFLTTVGVFVNEDPRRINEIADYCGLDMIQLHGDESPAERRMIRRRVIKAFRVKDSLDLPFGDFPADIFLLDAYVPGEPGGTGKRFNWALAREAKGYGRIILAGGLTPENVADAIRCAQPDGIDVSSGVERAPGQKDATRVREIVRIATSILHV